MANGITWRGATIALPLLALLCGAAGAAAERNRTTLWTGEDQWVRIEQQDPGAAPNDHPAKLDAGAVAQALRALELRDDESRAPVFTDEEIRNLAPNIASGLAKAGPQQDVTFATVGSHEVGSRLLKDPRVNAGRVFYADGKLNVLFGELQSNYRKRNLYGQRDEDFTPRRQGTRTKAGKQEYALTATDGVTLVRPDWATIDPAAAARSLAAKSATQPDRTTPAPAAAPPAATPAPAPPAAASAPEPAKSQPSGSAARATDTPPAAPAGSDLERRLRALKDLRDKGLISEEAYQAKMQELLKEL